ncbi:Mbeg1-like protein [Paenibacillus apiarius]|uniref:Mbeg1-like protein n=1 Tax=Paenibacillus apiarius TaxID=46240 RepID=UPI001981A054|nr:Mbeg1-like protein [Paenibacillus apiarius]MBN3524648.1 DUF2974 domain-containing protein [Paenibacillus apiarius]
MKKFSLMFLITVMSLSLLSSFNIGSVSAKASYASTLEMVKLSHYSYFNLETGRLGSYLNKPGKKTLFKELNSLSKNYKKEITTFDTMRDWVVVDRMGDSNLGFFGIAFKNPRVNEIVIAFRGTHDFLDFKQDFDLAMNRASAREQLAPAQIFVKGVANNNRGYKISLTGHSLGGWIAQYMVYRINEYGIIDDRILKNAETFNAPGYWKPSRSDKKYASLIRNNQHWNRVTTRYSDPINFIVKGDLVSDFLFDGHIGKKRKLYALGYDGAHSIKSYYAQPYKENGNLPK